MTQAAYTKTKLREAFEEGQRGMDAVYDLIESSNEIAITGKDMSEDFRKAHDHFLRAALLLGAWPSDFDTARLMPEEQRETLS